MAYVVDNNANSYGDATTNIQGGTLTSAYIGIRNRMDTYGANGGGNGKAILSVSGGEINGNSRAIWGQMSSATAEAHAKGEINITGGKIGLIDTPRNANADTMTTITGGTVAAFKGEVGELTVKAPGTVTTVTMMDASGKEVKYTVTADGLYVEVFPVMIGEQGYKTLQAAVEAAVQMDAESVTIMIAEGTYAEDLNLTNGAIGNDAKRPNITFQPVNDTVKVTLAGTVTVGYRQQNVSASNWNGEVTFKGITFDHAESEKHSLSIQDVNGITLDTCTVTGDGDYGIGTASGNSTTKAVFTNCTFNNGAMQVTGQIGAHLQVTGCTMNNFNFNVQGGTTPGMTIENSIFNMTLTDAHVGESFYVIRTNSCPVNLDGVKLNVKSTVTGTAADQAKWAIFWARNDSNAKWNVSDVEVNLTAAAAAQTGLLLVKNAATEKNADRITITGLISTSNNVSDLIAKSEGYMTANGSDYLNGKRIIKGSITYGYTSQTGIWGEASNANAETSYVVELYVGEQKIATSTLASKYLTGNQPLITWSIPFAGQNNEDWVTVWEEGYPTKDTQPTSVKLIIDGTEVSSNSVQMSGPDGIEPVEWEKLDYFKIVAKIGDVEYKTLEAAAAAAKSGDEIILLDDVTIAAEKDVTIPNGVVLNGNGFTINAANASDDWGYIIAGGELTIKGETKVEKFSASYYDHVVNIGAGASLNVFGSKRVTLGYGNTFNITGTIENAKTADKANVKPSLIIPAGISIAGSISTSNKPATMNVTNAYIQLGLTTGNKNGSGTFVVSFDNSIADISNNFSFDYRATGVFDLDAKNSVLNLAKNFDLATAKCDALFDNSVVTVGSSLRNDGSLKLVNGSEMTVKSQTQPGEHGGHIGTIAVDGSKLTVECTSIAHAIDGNNTGKLEVVNGGEADIDYIVEMLITVDTESRLTAKQIKDSTITVDATNFKTIKSEEIVTTALTAEQVAAIQVIGNEKASVEATETGIIVKQKGVAKVGGTEYATIDEAINNWTDNSTLTLLDDVTLTDVIKLSSTEMHTLDLGTFTMTAAKGKDAIQIEANGRTSASYALDIKADATNPGGIIATGKAVVKTTGMSGVKDRPIIRFYNGVFTGSNVVYHSGSNGTNCPQFYFYGGEFNGTVYANRALFQFYGGTFNGNLQISVDSSAYALISGGRFKHLSNLYGSALTSAKFMIASHKCTASCACVVKQNYDREVYIDDEGYYVVAATEPAEGFEAVVKQSYNSNNYFAYSKAASEGMKYTDVYAALAKNSEVIVYVDELDMSGITYNGTIVAANVEMIIKNAPAGLKVVDVNGNDLNIHENGSLFFAHAKIGETKYETVGDALAAAQTAGMTDVTITLIGNVTKDEAVSLDDSFNLYAQTQFKNVTFKQEDKSQPYYIAGIYTGSRTDGGKFVFDGVNLAITDQYMFEGNVELINNSKITSTAKANCFVYYANVTVNAGSSIKGVIEDIRGGTLTIDGGKTDGTYAETPGLWDAILTVNWTDSKLVLKNGAYVKVNSANEVGRLTVNGTMDVSSSKLESYQWITVSETGVLNVDGKSLLNTKKLNGAGKIVIDATGMTAGLVEAINADATGFTGTIEVISDNNLSARVNAQGRIELYQNVAEINGVKYESLQAAINACVAGDNTITLLADCAENVTIEQVEGVNITIDGNSKTYSGTIIIDGNSRNDGNETLTFQNVMFATDKASHYFIDANSAANTERYAHNVTVTNCAFMATGDAVNTAVAMRIRQGFDITINGKTAAKDMHSLLQAYGCNGITVDGVTITGKNGIAAGTSTGVKITNATIQATGYGIRADGEGAYDLTVSNSTINAELPIVVRKVETKGADYKLTLGDKVKLNGTNTEGYNVIFTTGDDGTYNAPNHKLNIVGGENLKVFPEYEASIGDVCYTNLKDAMKALQAGGTLELLKDVTIDEDWDCRNYGTTGDNATFNKVVTINGNGHTIKFTGKIDDKNHYAAFRFTAPATINELTIDMSEATSGFGTRLSAISTESNLTVDKCTFIGTGEKQTKAIIFGETTKTLSDVKVSVTNSTFQNWAYGVRDGDNGKVERGVKSVTVSGNTFTNASAYLSASDEAIFTNNAVTNGEVDIRSYAAETKLNVTANGNILDANKKNLVKDAVSYDNIQSEFTKSALVEVISGATTKYFSSVSEAFAAAKSGDEVKINKAGTYKVPSGKNLTITGAVDGVVFDNIGAHNMGGANVTFNNVTFDYYPNVNYTGLQHAGNMVYNNCIINGQAFLYGESETFNNCTFNQNSADAYNVWTYGAKNVAFNECTFNSAGKSVLIYKEGSDPAFKTDVSVTKSTFNASSTVADKAAIEMDSSLIAGINLTIDGETTATGFGTATNSKSSLWNNKKGNNTDANNDITVTVDGVVVLAPVTFVAKIGEVGYTSINDALKAAENGDTVNIFAGRYEQDLNINKDITVIGETTDTGYQLVEIIGKLSITADGATVKGLYVYSEGDAGYIHAKDVLIEGCEIAAGGNAFYQSYTNGSVTFKNSVIAGSVYGIHFDGNTDGNIVIEGCKIQGWTSFASTINKVTISDTEFAEGNENQLRFYQNAELTNVVFNPKMTVDFGANGTSASFVDCSVSDGSDLLDVIYLPDINGMGTAVTINGKPITIEATITKNGETVFYHTLADAIAAAKNGDVIVLDKDVTMSYGAREAYGAADLTSLTIDGNGHTLTLNQTNSDWSSIGLKNTEATLVLKNMTIEKTGKGDTSGAWNTHAIIFSNNVEMTDVTVNNAIAVQNGATLNNVTINEANGYYGLWINGNGQTVTVNGGAIIATNGGRGIKIADQYIDAPESVTLNITGTKFTTAKKAAVLVSSKAGAAITASNVDITNVAADSTNVAWVDEDWGAYYNQVTVNDKPAAQENVDAMTAAFLDVDGKVISYFKTLQAAVNAAEAGATITLVADAETTATTTINKSVTLDLNGKTISGTHGTEYAMMHVQNGANLTVKDSGEGGKITCAAGGNNTGAAVWVEGALVLESGTIEVTGSWNLGFAVDLRPNAWGTAHTAPASFVMNGGTVKSTDTAVRVASNSSDSYEELGVNFTMNGGAIESAWDAIFVQHLYNGDLNVDVKNGKITGTNSVVRIYGGAGSDVDIDIQGGEFVGVMKVADAYANTDAISISGGTYTVAPENVYVAPGYEVDYDTSKRVFNVIASKVAAVNGKDFATLAEAVEAAKNGGTIHLKRDVVLTETVQVPENAKFTLNLMGYTLNGNIQAPNAEITVENGSIKNTNKNVSAIEINAGKLTLNDVNIESARHAVRIDGASANVEAIINGGEYKIIGSGKTQHAINVSGAANVTINKGTFNGPKGTSAESGAAVNVQAGATVSITGGDFSGGKNNTLASSGTLTVIGGTYDQNPSAYVAKDYKVVKNADGKYEIVEKVYVAMIGEVGYESVAEALTAAQSGATIKLISGENVISMAGSVVGGKTVTITGTAIVDWTKGNLWIGREGVGDGKVIFDNATITSSVKKNPASYGIHVSGSKASDAKTNNGTLVIKDSNIELDYLINRNATTVEGNSTLTIYGGIYTHGRDASESASGTDETATLTIGAGSTVNVINENGMGVGGEGNGIMNVNGTYKANVLNVSAKGIVNIAGSAEISSTVKNNGSIVLTDVGATLTASECDNVTTDVADYKVIYEDGAYKLAAKVYVAQTGATKYETLAAAIAGSKAGDKIELIADVTENVTVNKSVTINGKKSDTENYKYAGKMTVNAGLNITVENIDFVNGGIDKTAKTSSGNYTIRNCTFKGEGKFAYAFHFAGAGNVSIEKCTVENYQYSFLYINSGTGSVSVKDVTVDGCPNYAVYFGSGVNSAAFENLTVKNSNNGFIINNTADRAFTIKNVKMENVTNAINHANGTNSITCTVLGNENDFGTAASSQYAKYVLAEATATLTAPAGATVTTSVEGYEVEYVDGKYIAVPIVRVAKIGETKYKTLAAAIAGSKAGDKIELIADVTENVTVNKSVTINGKKSDTENYKYTGKMTVNAGLNITVENIDFVNGGIDKTAKTSSGNYTIRNCTFKGEGKFAYAFHFAGAGNVSIEKCTVENYQYSFLYINSGTGSVSVKDVTVDGCPNYAVYFGSGVNSAAFENLTVKNSNNGFIINNTADRAFTIKNVKMENVTNAINHANGTNSITCTVLGNENDFGTAASSQYAKYVLAEATATLKASDKFAVTSGMEDYTVFYKDGKHYLAQAVAQIGETKFETFAEALNAVQNGETITLIESATGSELSKEIEFTKDIEFTITGKAPEYALPVVTFQNATMNIKDAEILIPELDARQNATINVMDSIVHDAGGNSIVKSYYNGAINISGNSVVHTMQVTTMGYITVSDTAKLNATWQTNVYGNGMITVKDDATFATAAMHLTGKEYSGRDNTDADRVGKPATIVVDGAKLIVGKVISDNGADYSYNSKEGINIGTIDGKKAVLDIKNNATVEIYMANGETANVGANGTVNVDGTVTVACRAADGAATLVNNGSIVLKETDAVLNANECGKVTTDVADYKVIYENGTYKLTKKQYVAEIKGGEKFESLQAAIDAAQNDETVTLLKDINLAEIAYSTLDDAYDTCFKVEGKSITVDMNGMKISGAYKNTGKTPKIGLVGVFSTGVNGHLTLTGNGTIDVTADENNKVYYLLSNYDDDTASMTIKNGTYRLNAATDALVHTANNNLVVDGGTFILNNVGIGNNGQPWIFNANGKNAKHVTVNGGTFNADVAHQFWANEVYIPENLALKNNGNGTWTIDNAVAYVTERAASDGSFDRSVGYATLAEAIDAKGTDVTIVANCELTQVWENSYTITVTEGVTFTMAENASIVLKTMDATVKAAEGLNVITNITDHKVDYVDGVYKVVPKDYNVEIQNGEKFETLAEAIVAAKDGDTIVFLDAIEENVVVDKNVTIDGDEFKYTGEMKMAGGKTVTVKDVNFIKGCIETIKNIKNKLTVENCDFDGVDCSINYAVAMRAGSSVTIVNCTAKHYALDMLWVPNAVTNVTVQDTQVTECRAAVNVAYGTNITLENVKTSAVEYGIQTHNNGPKTIILRNCDLEGDNSIHIKEIAEKTAVDTFIFEGKNIIKTLSTSKYAKQILNPENGNIDEAMLITPEVKDLEIDTTTADYKVVYDTAAYKLVKKDYVAQIGETKYESLAEAFEAAVDGDKIIMIADHVMDGSKPVQDDEYGYDNLIVNGKSITLDFAGHTVEVTPNSTDANNGLPGTLESVIFIQNGGSLTLKDETGKGGFYVKSGTSLYSLIYNSGSTLVIEGGNYHVEKLLDSIIFADKPTEQKTIIKGGVFTLDNAGEKDDTKPWIFNVYRKNEGFVEVSGGYFNDNPHKNLGTAKDCEVEIADGKFFKQITSGEYAGYWTLGDAVAQNVQTGKAYNDVQVALNEANSDETVQLLTDVEAGSLMVTKGITLDLNGKSLTTPYLVAFNTNHVVDNSTDKTGKLYVTQNNIMLASNNSQMPIWNGDHYIFAVATMRYDATKTTNDMMDIVFRPTFGKAINNLFADGMVDNGLKLVVYMSWTNAKGNNVSQDFVVTEQLVMDMYGRNQACHFVSTGLSKYDNVKARCKVVSDLGVEIVTEEISLLP